MKHKREMKTAIADLNQSLLEFQVGMDFFEHRYYKLNKILLTILGQWPYQTTLARSGYRALLFFLLATEIGPQIMAVVKYRNDWEIIVECISPLLIEAICVTKLICHLLNSQTRLTLLDRTRMDWQVWSRDREVNILHAYAEQGRKMATVYAASIFSAGILYMTQPVLPKIIDTLFKNGSEPGEFPFPVDYYFFDGQKYYFYVIMYSYVSVSMIVMIITACDAMFIVYVQHGCGLFAALGHKLERIKDDEEIMQSETNSHSLNKRDVDYEYLGTCIDRHNDAIEYASLIEASYVWCFFFVVGFNMLIISVTGFQIVTRNNKPEEIIRFISFVGAQMVHLYAETYISQVLMDHSINIRYHIHNAKWHRMSIKAQKLLNLMIMRCNVPCRLTAGKICVMSIGTFGVVLKTSASYFTLLRSL